VRQVRNPSLRITFRHHCRPLSLPSQDHQRSTPPLFSRCFNPPPFTGVHPVFPPHYSPYTTTVVFSISLSLTLTFKRRETLTSPKLSHRRQSVPGTPPPLPPTRLPCSLTRTVAHNLSIQPFVLKLGATRLPPLVGRLHVCRASPRIGLHGDVRRCLDRRNS
ncbi:hypothetical protein PIB30_069996, partial [Stylosanthes scabra]|nr:hypothetical protein [Stylosanthes scabra]